MSVNTQRLNPIGTSVPRAPRANAHRDHSLVAALRHLRDRVVLARKRRAAINELARLSDWQLNDIGIQRGLIPDAVDAALRRESDSLRAAGSKHS